MIPDEIIIPNETLGVEANMGLEMKMLVVMNTGDRPIQVGSHFHFLKRTRRCDSTAKQRAVFR